MGQKLKKTSFKKWKKKLKVFFFVRSVFTTIVFNYKQQRSKVITTKKCQRQS